MTAYRMLFLTTSTILFVGIWLTGFATVHWLLYVPAVFLCIAGLTGFCPGYRFWKMLGFP